MKKPPRPSESKSLPRPLRKEGSPYWMKICNTLLTYPPLSEWDSPPFGGAGGGWRSGGRLSRYTVTRYTLHFLLMEFSWGGRDGIVYYYI